ncbi:hypothetical protein ABL78_3348 [Leptomonas seymouri]|uniref:CNH domain-containing protein n=1 Tax=Leptomonas seymouri TaxID=5684 RepID=A0A0N1PCT4_LEPSE|nr:hypothetical protein ABL78_3348 [Leptomonas seymouri]|eukprot:KPI87551.1 hypothetical protein ABL78_3348 [Leptomonas seymouri]
MQCGEASEALGVEVYRLVPLGGSMPYVVECMTTYDDLLFVGTHNSKLVAYRIQTDHGKGDSPYSGSESSTSSSLMLLQEVSSTRRHPVRALTVVGDHYLLALIDDTIVLYHFHHDPSQPFQLREVTAMTGLKETISFHVKRHRGTLSLVVLQRRRLTIYEATAAHMEFLLKETVALPDGVRTIGWLGRSFVLGGRKEYFLYHASSSSSTALYPTPRSGAIPFVLPMTPIPEVLIAGEGGGMRALLSDGSEVPGGLRVCWTSPPVDMIYEHPYVVSQHSTGPHTVQIRLPLLTTLEETAVKNKSCLVQCIAVPKLAKMSQCWWTDYDCPMPTASTNINALARHPIVVADTSNRLSLLARTPVAAQVEKLAARSWFAVADLLCQLCPHEVPADALKRVVAAGAVHRFVHLKDYAGCFHELSKVEADPRLAVRLFPGFSPPEDAANCPPLPIAPPPGVAHAALPPLVEYLRSRRAAILQQGKTFLTTETARAQLMCVDRALVLAWCTMNEEAPLLALLQAESWCNVADTVALLQEHEQWVALTVFLEVHGEYERTADELARLVGAGGAEEVARKTLPTEVIQALHRFFTEHSVLPTSDEVYLPQGTIQSWAAAEKKDSAPSKNRAVTTALIGMSAALTFFRRQALPSQQKLFARHLTWVLGCVPPEIGLRIFFSTQNVQQYAVVLQLLQGYAEMPGGTSKQLLLVSYLHLLFADARARVSEEALYEQYYRGLAELLFTEAPSTASLSEETRQRCRYRLDKFLLTSSHVNLDAAEQYFSADSIKAQCVPEQALIYRRQGAHRKAVNMFLGEADDMAGAVAYARSASSEGNGDAFTALLELLLKPLQGPPRLEEALTILDTCDGVDAASVLPMLPDELPLAQLSRFLMHAFRNTATAYHMSAIDSSVLNAKLMLAQETCVRERSRSALLEHDTVCPVCRRKLRPDTVLAVYPNGVLVHHGCVRDECVCPVTHRDSRYDAYSLLEDL